MRIKGIFKTNFNNCKTQLFLEFYKKGTPK